MDYYDKTKGITSFYTHLEFRSINNLMKINNGTIFKTNEELYNFFINLTDFVNIFYNELFDIWGIKYDTNTLYFGLEIETCFNNNVGF